MIFKIYENKEFEEEMALYRADTKEVIMYGDYYHDKIDKQIEGFFKGLDYVGVSYILSNKREHITKDHQDFKACGFSEWV